FGGCVPDAVRDLVADVNQLVRWEEARQLGRADIAHLDPAVLDHVGVGDLARGSADRNRDIIVAIEMFELLDQIVTEEVRARNAGRIASRLVQPREGPWD